MKECNRMTMSSEFLELLSMFFKNWRKKSESGLFQISC